MIIAALSLAAQLANPGFERGLDGWQTDRHRGMGIEIGSNRGYTIRQAAEGEQFLAMGWRARSGAPAEAFSPFPSRSMPAATGAARSGSPPAPRRRLLPIAGAA